GERADRQWQVLKRNRHVHADQNGRTELGEQDIGATLRGHFECRGVGGRSVKLVLQSDMDVGGIRMGKTIHVVQFNIFHKTVVCSSARRAPLFGACRSMRERLLRKVKADGTMRSQGPPGTTESLWRLGGL